MPLNIVTTKYGSLRGVRKQTHTVFRGVPYAKPPVGEMRFKKPQEPEPWDGLLEANSFRARCMQLSGRGSSYFVREFYGDDDFIPPMSEDSLLLNIWTPAETGNERLPVAFWLHGGGFASGCGSEIEFDGKEYCERGVILVTVNYRLGAFGFLSHPALSAENSGISGNYGIYDQLAALKWVYENIEAFGGDKDRITIFGQSAGSMSVQILVSSPLTKGMIAGAIIQSGGGYRSLLNRYLPLQDAETVGTDFLNFCSASSVQKLRSMPAKDLSKLAVSFSAEIAEKGMSFRPFAPVIDGALIPQNLDLAIERGNTHDIPYMIGSTADDIGTIPGVSTDTGKDALYKACSEFSLMSEKLGRKPAFVYHFKRVPQGGDGLGSFHSAELWYMFGTLNRSWRPKSNDDYELSRLMLEYWCNFIKNGDPNSGGLEEWRLHSESDKYVREFL